MYDIKTLVEEKLVFVRRYGFLGGKDVASFRSELQRAIAKGSTWDYFDILVDLSEAPPVQQETLASLQSAAASLTKSNARRVALVTGSMLTKLQVRRNISSTTRLQLFEHASAARHWLNDQ